MTQELFVEKGRHIITGTTFISQQLCIYERKEQDTKDLMYALKR